MAKFKNYTKTQIERRTEFNQSALKMRNTRNLDKQFRPQRLAPSGGIHPLDGMKAGHDKNLNVKISNTTGCYGTPTTFGIRVQQFGPRSGKNRTVKKKSPCRLGTTRQIRDSLNRTAEAAPKLTCALAFSKINLKGGQTAKVVVSVKALPKPAKVFQGEQYSLNTTRS